MDNYLVTKEERLLISMVAQAMEDYINNPSELIIQGLRSNELLFYIEEASNKVADILSNDIELAKTMLKMYYDDLKTRNKIITMCA